MTISPAVTKARTSPQAQTRGISRSGTSKGASPNGTRRAGAWFPSDLISSVQRRMGRASARQSLQAAPSRRRRTALRRQGPPAWAPSSKLSCMSSSPTSSRITTSGPRPRTAGRPAPHRAPMGPGRVHAARRGTRPQFSGSAARSSPRTRSSDDVSTAASAAQGGLRMQNLRSRP